MKPFLTEYGLHGASLALASFFIVNMLASALVAVGAKRLSVWRSGSADMWLLLRLLPAAATVVFVATMLLPSYLSYEPLDSGEGFGVTLTVCAVAALIVIAASCARGLQAWASADRRARAWMRTAQPLRLPGSTLPTYEISADTPVMALVGILRPRLLVTRGLIDALTEEELAVSIAHEISHGNRRDNLKRLLMRSAPDVLRGTAAAGFCEQQWAAAAEHRADRLSSGGDPVRRYALASALLKVARLKPACTPALEPISTLIGGGDIASRVQCLLDEPVPAPLVARRGWVVSIAAIVMFGLVYVPLLRGVHEISEILVNSLP